MASRGECDDDRVGDDDGDDSGDTAWYGEHPLSSLGDLGYRLRCGDRILLPSVGGGDETGSSRARSACPGLNLAVVKWPGSAKGFAEAASRVCQFWIAAAPTNLASIPSSVALSAECSASACSIIARISVTLSS
jgi:hypothetical protein